MIIFSHRSKFAGGVQTLIINLTAELIQQGFSILIIDDSDGYIHTYLKKNRIKHLFLEFNSLIENKLETTLNDTYVSFGNFESDWLIFRYLNVKIFFWQVHPDFLSLVFRIRHSLIPESIQTKNFITSYFRRKLYTKLVAKNGIAFMSESHIKYALKCLVSDMQSRILPIPVNNIPKDIINRKIECERELVIRLVYIGRPQDWKILPLVVLVQEINRQCKMSNYSIKLSVITTESEKFVEVLKKYNLWNSLEISFVLGKSGAELEEYLVKNADIVFSMGTSLLEAAKLGIPAVFADACMNGFLPFPYNYRWLFETSGRNLGNPIYNQKDVLPGKNLDEIFNEFLNDRILNNIGRQCFEYTRTYHSLNEVTKKFLYYVESNRFQAIDFYEFSFFFRLKKKLVKFGVMRNKLFC